MTALHHDYSTLDRYDGLGEQLAPTPRTYPAGWFILALFAAVLFAWLPVLVFAAIGFLILGVLKVLGVRRG